jgi:hypothetical protein
VLEISELYQRFGDRVAVDMASIYWVARFAGRIYATSLVRGGARLSWRAALRTR